MKVLLINPKFYDRPSWIPYGLLCLASYLEHHGVNCEIHDRNIRRDEENHEHLKSFILSYKPDLIGIGGMTYQGLDAINTGYVIKKLFPDIKIVYGGAHFSFQPEEAYPFADLVVIGEGEETLLEICRGVPKEEIKGIAYKKDGVITYTPERDFISLDNYPQLRYDKIKILDYVEYKINKDMDRSVTILTGRGCPYNCSFCASPQLWKRKVRYFPLERVMENIDYIVKNTGIKSIRIFDDTFNIDKERVIKFCDLVKDMDLSIDFFSHTKTLQDVDVLKHMKSAGMNMTCFGVECANDGILKILDKNITCDEVALALDNLHKAGIIAVPSFMIGNPGETLETIKDSVRFAVEHNFDGINYFQFTVPHVGSRLNGTWKNYGEIIEKNEYLWNQENPVFIPHGLNKDIMYHWRGLTNTILCDFSKVKQL